VATLSLVPLKRARHCQLIHVGCVTALRAVAVSWLACYRLANGRLTGVPWRSGLPGSLRGLIQKNDTGVRLGAWRSMVQGNSTTHTHSTLHAHIQTP